MTIAFLGIDLSLIPILPDILLLGPAAYYAGKWRGRRDARPKSALQMKAGHVARQQRKRVGL